VRNIGDSLVESHIPFAYYGDQFNIYKNDPYFLNPNDNYCNICNFFQYSKSIMTNASVRTSALKDTVDLYAEIKNGTLPAASFVKPSGLLDGHPASSKLNLFEGFTKKIVDAVKSNPELWKETAIFVTFDEGGGYYDSGYVQPLDFFGDGTRIPLMVVSPYTKPGHNARLFRPRLDSQVHRAQLVLEPDNRSQPGQPSQSEVLREQIRADEYPGNRRLNGPV
jgi:phospholipase C